MSVDVIELSSLFHLDTILFMLVATFAGIVIAHFPD